MNGAIRLGLVTTFAGLMATTLPPGAYAQPAAKAASGSSAKSIVDAATTDAAKRAAFVKTGQRVAEFCANCHGENGTSKMADVPNMAGQNVEYIFEQMRKFLAGERRDDTAFMKGLLKALKPEEKAAIASYYAQSPPIPARSAAGPNAVRGKTVYTTRCVQCHGEDGAGAETMPRVAGQQTGYLNISLERYRNGTGARLFAPMTESMRGLTKEDLAALVDYLSSMR